MTNSKSKILESIRQNIRQEKVSYPTIPTFEQEGKDIVQTFQESLLNAGATFYKVSNIEEAKEISKKLFPEAKIIASATPEWIGNKDISINDQPQSMEDVDVAIVRSHVGVAETGMVWLTEKDLIVNSLGFLCQNIVILLDPKNITENMNTAYNKVSLSDIHYGCFVMGPSATADIGATLIHGAQGPRTLIVFLLEE